MLVRVYLALVRGYLPIILAMYHPAYPSSSRFLSRTPGEIFARHGRTYEKAFSACPPCSPITTYLRVREVLLGLSGVSKVLASSARKQVAVAYDDSVRSPDRIAQALVEAGYPPNEELPILGQHRQSEDGSPWYTVLRPYHHDRDERPGNVRRFSPLLGSGECSLGVDCGSRQS